MKTVNPDYPCGFKQEKRKPEFISQSQAHDAAVAKPSVNALVGMGSHLGTGSNPERVFKGSMGRCKVTTPSSLSLTSNRVTTNY